MSKTLACARCLKAGYVRVETIIHAGETVRAFYCGACGHRWSHVETERSLTPGTTGDSSKAASK